MPTEMQEIWVHAPRGVTLYGQLFNPEADAAPSDRVRDVVVILHGRTEFCEKYGEVTERLTAAGYTVATFDWRGQGRSTRPSRHPHRGHIRRFSDYLDDVDAFMAQAVRPLNPARLFLLGHSMGGHVGMRYLLERGEAWDWRAAAFSAPMWDLTIPKLTRRLIHAVGRAASTFGFSTRYAPGMGDYRSADQKFKGNVLTTDKARFDRMHQRLKRAPELATGGPTIGWVHEALLSIDRLACTAQQVQTEVPVLVLSSMNDKVVDSRAHDRIAATQPKMEVYHIANAQHEPLQERDEIFEFCIQTIVDFFDKQRQTAS
ncbi:MAG: alpha/beta hydrolase [Alphaproteobacteria bacterium]|nr:alpha/beta hydrolase [Alphaproteobacteria bacterium]